MMTTIFRRNTSLKESPQQRRPGVTPQHDKIIETVTKHPKTKEDEMFIRSAIENNDFLCSLLQNKKLQDVIECMYPEIVKPNQTIIKEGEDGSHLYVSITGLYEVIQNDEIVTTFSDVRVFGELALLYTTKRLATVRARTSGRIWILDRVVFKHLVRPEIDHHEDTVRFLQEVPKLNSVPLEVLEEVARLLKLEFFETGTKIVEEGDKKPDKFYIVKAGSVTVSKTSEGRIDRLYRGSFFGELALLKEKERKATVTADAPGTECLILARKDFIAHFGSIPDCFSINVQVQPYKPMDEIIEHTDLSLGDFKIVAKLTNSVELVQHISKKELVFALKTMEKHDLQSSCKNNFIVRLYRTYQNRKCLYSLLEPCLGGDLWTHLHKQRPCYFDKEAARFYAACVVEAFDYLHEHRIVYRDLKPENLLIDAKGYVKLTDFGYAKQLQMMKKSFKKTYTFVGTPEYVAPEIILNQGHDKGVDYWALGIFIFEILAGYTPFRSEDVSYMKTYKLILKGIEDVCFPKQVMADAEDLVKKLCKSTPCQRLGCLNGGIRDVKDHAWFEGFQWELLEQCKLPAPFRPNLKTNVDVHYFGKTVTERKLEDSWSQF